MDCLPLQLFLVLTIVFLAFSGFWSCYVNVEFLFTLSFSCIFSVAALVLDRVASSMSVIYFTFACLNCGISVSKIGFLLMV